MAEIQDIMDKLEDVMGKLDDVEDKLGELEIKIDEDKWFYKPCPRCNASGTIPDTTTGCTPCEGSGFIKTRIISKEEK
jgi:RecJ-like exonuclease